MTETREQLLDRMIRIYGFEHECVIAFAKLAETDVSDRWLKALVKAHEEYPLIGDEDEE